MLRPALIAFALVALSSCAHSDATSQQPARATHPRKKPRPTPQRLTTVPISNDFETVTLIPATPLKDQESSGTCWSFATTSFLEAEALRLKKPAVSLSPIFYVPPTYLAKAERFVQRNGDSYFDAGDLTFSVLDAYRKFGAVPETVYDGIIAGDWQHDHVEMDNLLQAMVKSVATSGYGRIKPDSWRASMKGVLRAYLGQPPERFDFRGRTFTPKTFAAEMVGIDPTQYVEVTSFSHLPHHEMAVLDIPANWGRRAYLNLPFDDFKRLADHALQRGYSLAWDGDASEDGFDHAKGVAQLSSEAERQRVTAATRQHAFEAGRTTDDHNMHLIGVATDREGRKHYVMKNSEGDNARGGYVYMSQQYLLLKTISLLVHRDALPIDVKSRLDRRQP